MSALFSLSIQNNKTFIGPNSEELSSIIFTNIADYIGIEKIIIDELQDIESILELLKTAKKAKGKQSPSDFPDNTKFTTIIFGFEFGGNSWRSMYLENDELYIEQPYDYVYKLGYENKELLYKVIKSGSKEGTSMNLKEILIGTF